MHRVAARVNSETRRKARAEGASEGHIQTVTSGNAFTGLRDDDADGTSHAQIIVKELYTRYQKQLQRWKDYRSLFFFLAFVSLFLAVLYTQRQANTAFQVHSTLASVLLPSDTVMGSTDDVYNWLTGLLTAVWVDPVCGDGICEAPFEFASYSTFGCRADCGQLQNVQNLTKLQIDVYFDFSHPIGSIPASDLMQQTSWNLCPTQTTYSTACYYSTDIMFVQLSGSTTTTIFDCPDGNWDLLLKRDIFMKTRGAVRDYSQLQAISYYYRVYLAALSAIAEQNTEMLLLNQAVALGTQNLLQYVNSSLQASAPNTTFAKFQFQQFVNATCGCYNTPLNSSTTLTWGSSGLLLNAFNNSNNPFNTYSDYLTQVCAPNNASSPVLYEIVQQNITSNGTLLPIGALTTGLNVTLINQTVVTTNATRYCSNILGSLTGWRTNMTSTMQSLMIDQRLGDGKTTGKIAARNTIYGNLRNNIINNWPELFDPIFTYPTGSIALGSGMPSAQVSVLQVQFVAGITYATQPMPAYLNITRKTIYASNVTVQSMVERAIARLNETRFQQLQTLSIAVPLDPTYNYGYPDTVTVQSLLQAFYAAESNPDPYYASPLR